MFSPREKFGPYSLIQKVGRGASGEVWLAERRTIINDPTKVALKIIPLQDEMELVTIKQEATLWVRATGHQNIVSIIEADIYDGYVVITSEYVPGGSLADWLKKRGGEVPNIQAAVDIVSGILSGLAHLHKHNIIHRDIKPANILMQGNTPRITDFGVSRLFSSTRQSNHISGTTSYMSPEALDGWCSAQVDIWSAGVILYRLLIGYLPFQGPTDSAVMYAISHGEPAVIPSSIPTQLKEVLIRSLQRDLGRRYKSAIEMRQALMNASRLSTLPTITDSTNSVLRTSVDADEPDDHTREATKSGEVKAERLESRLSRLVRALNEAQKLNRELPTNIAGYAQREREQADNSELAANAQEEQPFNATENNTGALGQGVVPSLSTSQFNTEMIGEIGDVAEQPKNQAQYVREEIKLNELPYASESPTTESIGRLTDVGEKQELERHKLGEDNWDAAKARLAQIAKEFAEFSERTTRAYYALELREVGLPARLEGAEKVAERFDKSRRALLIERLGYLLSRLSINLHGHTIRLFIKSDDAPQKLVDGKVIYINALTLSAEGISDERIDSWLSAYNSLIEQEDRPFNHPKR